MKKNLKISLSSGIKCKSSNHSVCRKTEKIHCLNYFWEFLPLAIQISSLSLFLVTFMFHGSRGDLPMLCIFFSVFLQRKSNSRKLGWGYRALEECNVSGGGGPPMEHAETRGSPTLPQPGREMCQKQPGMHLAQVYCILSHLDRSEPDVTNFIQDWVCDI